MNENTDNDDENNQIEIQPVVQRQYEEVQPTLNVLLSVWRGIAK